MEMKWSQGQPTVAPPTSYSSRDTPSVVRFEGWQRHRQLEGGVRQLNRIRRDVCDILDCLSRPAELGDDLFIGESCERGMGLVARGELVRGSVGVLEDVEAGDSAGADDEEGTFERGGLGTEVVCEVGGAVVE